MTTITPDWPTRRKPCDPAISTDGDTMWISCTGDDRADSESPTPIWPVEPGMRWSELVAAVAEHRCAPASGPDGAALGDACAALDHEVTR